MTYDTTADKFADQVNGLIQQGWIVYPESVCMSKEGGTSSCLCLMYRSKKEYDRNYGDCSKKPQQI